MVTCNCGGRIAEAVLPSLALSVLEFINSVSVDVVSLALLAGGFLLCLRESLQLLSSPASCCLHFFLPPLPKKESNDACCFILICMII